MTDIYKVVFYAEHVSGGHNKLVFEDMSDDCDGKSWSLKVYEGKNIRPLELKLNREFDKETGIQFVKDSLIAVLDSILG